LNPKIKLTFNVACEPHMVFWFRLDIGQHFCLKLGSLPFFILLSLEDRLPSSVTLQGPLYLWTKIIKEDTSKNLLARSSGS